MPAKPLQDHEREQFKALFNRILAGKGDVALVTHEQGDLIRRVGEESKERSRRGDHALYEEWPIYLFSGEASRVVALIGRSVVVAGDSFTDCRDITRPRAGG